MSTRAETVWAWTRWVLWPRLRRPRPWSSLLPSVILAAGFIGACLALQAGNVVWFVRPWLLGLALLTPWFARLSMTGYAGLAPMRNRLALALRLVLLAVLIIAIAQPRSVRTDRSLSIVFAVDLSASIDPRLTEQAMSQVAQWATQKPAHDEAGLVLFGQDAAVEMPPAMTLPLDEGLTSTIQVSRDGTNIEKALRLSAALLPEGRQGRIVLISDGAATEGRLADVLDELKSRRIAVDVLPVNYQHDKEVWLTRLELPRVVRQGETYEAAALLQATAPGTGELTLRENGQVIFREQVQYQAGRNRFTLPLYLRDPGYYEYEATIEPGPGQDGVQRNNKAISYLQLRGEGKVLLVTDAQGDSRDWQTLANLLKQEQRELTVMTSYEMPSDAMSLLPYDLIIFANVGAEGFSTLQFQALRDAVYHQGSGFLMVGGENSFGPGGYHRTLVEDVLPVSMDVSQRKVLPKGALAITLHTCEFADGNTWAKRITKQAIQVLSAQDEAGVLVFDWQGGDKWLFELTPAAELKKMTTAINAAQIGDMPSFVPTMQMALAALQKADASAKHMIIISDGDPQPPSPQLLQQFQQAKISVTTVAVFPHNGDTSVMQMIANLTGGRFYYPQDARLLPSIFIKEAKTLKRNMIQEVDFVPEIEMPSPVLKGIDAIPMLKGYVLTTPKPRSTTIFKAPQKEDTDPVLTTWRFGVGKTAAWTSDLSPKWAAPWMDWGRFRGFVQQLVTDLSRVERPTSLEVQSYAVGGEGRVVVEDTAADASLLNMQAVVIGPGQRQETIRLEQVSPRRYEARFPLWGEGRYQAIAQATGDGREERVFTGFVLPYSDEYLRFRADPILLDQIRDRTGGRSLSGSETGQEIFDLPRVTNAQSKPIFDWLLVLLACLIPLDVAFRRVHLDWQVIRSWVGLTRTVTPSDETFGALLKRKKVVSTTLAQNSAGGEGSSLRALRQARAGMPPGDAPPPPPSPQAARPKDRPQDESKSDDSTTSRLLARKRQRRDQEHDQP